MKAKHLLFTLTLTLGLPSFAASWTDYMHVDIMDHPDNGAEAYVFQGDGGNFVGKVDKSNESLGSNISWWAGRDIKVKFYHEGESILDAQAESE